MDSPLPGAHPDRLEAVDRHLRRRRWSGRLLLLSAGALGAAAFLLPLADLLATLGMKAPVLLDLPRGPRLDLLELAAVLAGAVFALGLPTAALVHQAAGDPDPGLLEERMRERSAPERLGLVGASTWSRSIARALVVGGLVLGFVVDRLSLQLQEVRGTRGSDLRRMLPGR